MTLDYTSYRGTIDLEYGLGKTLSAEGYEGMIAVQTQDRLGQLVIGSAADETFIINSIDTVHGGAGTDQIVMHVGTVNFDRDSRHNTVTAVEDAVSTGSANFYGQIGVGMRLEGGSGANLLSADGYPLKGSEGPGNMVLRLFDAGLDRAPDGVRLKIWTEVFKNDPYNSRLELAHAVINSAEFVARFGADLGHADLTDVLYQNMYGRNATDGEMAQIESFVASQGSRYTDNMLKAHILLRVVSNGTFRDQTAPRVEAAFDKAQPMTWTDDVFRLYQATLDRLPDVDGLVYWTELLAVNKTLEQVVEGLVRSPEFNNVYGTDLSDTAFVTLLYENVLGRAPDAQGLTY